MPSILSIQSHVVYGYVGNKASTYPMQAMGFDVWPINTVQFSNHTGYGVWEGEIFDEAHISKLVDGIFDINQHTKCSAILSGYMGSAKICNAVLQIVQKFKAYNHEVLYLCDPVIGNNKCYVKPEVLEFFKNNLIADIITPNHYEAEILSGMKIKSFEDLKLTLSYFFDKGIKIIVITGVKFAPDDTLKIFVADGQHCFFVEMQEYEFTTPINGTGDLFSGVFLGAYLKHNNLQIALQYASYYLDQAVYATLVAKERELQILSVDYKNVVGVSLPKINFIS